MLKVSLDKQLMITVDNQTGMLAEIIEAVSMERINIFAICAYAVDNRGVVMLVTEDNIRAKRLLTSKKYTVREEEVILLTVENKPGTLQSITKRLAQAGINIRLIYGSVDQKAQASRLVLISDFNNSVLDALKGLASSSVNN